MKSARYAAGFLVVLLCACASSVSEPGSRDYQAPWFGLGSLEGRIIDLLDKVADTQREMSEALNATEEDYAETLQELEAKRREASRIGWPVITDSKRDYAQRIEEVRRELAAEKQDVRSEFEKSQDALEAEIKAALASPPDESARERMERVRPGTPTREAQEVYNALVNLRESILALNSRLAQDSSNYRLAATTYKAQIQLFRYVIQMNQEFRQRIDQVYRPGMKELEKRIAVALKNTEASSMPADRKAREMQKLEKIRAALEQGYPKLARQSAWAARNIETVQELLDVHETLLENVEIAGDAAALVANVNAEIEDLDFVPPVLIEYDLEAADFEITDVDDAQTE
ncbi:MAG TPA: hypothetical protein VF275_13175 [Gammaproteobacteria bacterium]